VTETLILIPGLLCDATVWKPQVAAFGGRVQTVVADHGLLNSLGAMAEAIIERAPARFAVAGHSMGGRVALEVYRRVPERVTALALLDTGCHPVAPGEAGQKEAAGRYALLEAAKREGMRAMAWLWLQGMVHRTRLEERPLVDAILDMMASKTPEIFEAQIQALLSRQDARPLLNQISCPTLVLCGHEDSWSPVKQHQDIAAAIRNSKLVTVPECGHMSTLERPDAVNAALGDWLKAIA
jgi:pimeloyl-ACP methyl ester carboxylesterase